MDEQLKRIEYYEDLLNKAADIIRKKPFLAKNLPSLQDCLKQLDEYYASESWKGDFSDEEKGLIPGDVRRGVLSEDGIYNVLEDGEEWTDEVVGSLMEKPYYLIDLLPERVQAEGKGRFFDVERCIISSQYAQALRRRFSGVVLKLYCYKDISVFCGGEKYWKNDPSPEEIEEIIAGKEHCLFLLPEEETLISLNNDDIFMTVYNLSASNRDLLEKLAGSEGLFLRRNKENE